MKILPTIAAEILKASLRAHGRRDAQVPYPRRRSGAHLIHYVVGLTALLAMLLVLVNCTGVTADRGYDCGIRVSGAQLVRATFPVANGGPALPLVDLRTTTFGPGDAANPINGRAGSGTFAINVGLVGDPGYWVVPVGLPDEANTGELQFRAIIDFSRQLSLGAHEIVFQAVDEFGRDGVSVTANIVIQSRTPAARLRMTLSWDTEADVDLVVKTPDGIILDSKNINTLVPPPPGAPLPADNDYLAGGIIDFDSNANCVIDGKRSETAYWSKTPPRGHYLIYAAMTSTCGVGRTAARLEIVGDEGRSVYLDTLFATDGRPTEDATTPGVLMAEFDVR